MSNQSFVIVQHPNYLAVTSAERLRQAILRRAFTGQFVL